MRVARCDYCGTLFPIGTVVLYWVHVETLSDGESEVCTTGHLLLRAVRRVVCLPRRGVTGVTA